jgi:hypothetical protein
MNRFARIFALVALPLAVLGCEARTDKSDGGGILLSLSIDGWPAIVSASNPTVPPVTIEEMIVTSIVKNPSQATSQLMRVELEKYEVTFQRDDTGTRLPPRLVENIIASVDPGGTFTCENCFLMRVDQFAAQPLRDMIEYGRDRETDSPVVRLRVGIQFYGRTISGDSVSTAPASFTMEVVP